MLPTQHFGYQLFQPPSLHVSVLFQPPSLQPSVLFQPPSLQPSVLFQPWSNQPSVLFQPPSLQHKMFLLLQEVSIMLCFPAPMKIGPFAT